MSNDEASGNIEGVVPFINVGIKQKYDMILEETSTTFVHSCGS